MDYRQLTDERFDELQRERSEFRQAMRAGFAKVEASAAKRQADFMKWTLGFWVASLLTYVGALVALALVLR